MSVLALALLTGLPASATVCAMLCESATMNGSVASGHHHGSASHAQEPIRSTAEPKIHGVSGHDCSSHDAALGQASTTAAERADRGVTSIPLVTTTTPGTFKALTEPGPSFDYSAPPGTASPTTTPVVLRV